MRGLDNSKLVFTAEAIAPLLEELLKQLNVLITESDGLPNYALMSLFRVVSISKDKFAPYSKGFSTAIGTFIRKAFKDPTTSAYSIYILFETMGYVTNIINDSQGISNQTYILKDLQDEVLPILNEIVVDGDRTDIIIYIFQVYAAFVLNSSCSQLNETYGMLAKSILEDPTNTDVSMKYLVPGELKLICSILYKYPAFFAPYKAHLFGLLERVLNELSLEEDAVNLLA
jgi:hypothetical protein